MKKAALLLFLLIGCAHSIKNVSDCDRVDGIKRVECNGRSIAYLSDHQQPFDVQCGDLSREFLQPPGNDFSREDDVDNVGRHRVGSCGFAHRHVPEEG